MKSSSISKKRRGVINAALSLILVAGLLPAVQAATPTQAYANSPALEASAVAITSIGTADDLVSFATSVANGITYEGKTVTVTADIDLTGTTFNGIGSATARFAGTFDGAGHTIKGIAITSSETVTGFFAATTNTATIKDFTATGTLTCTAEVPNFSAQLFGIGGIVGVNRGTISGITSNIAVTATSGFTTGGIAGFNAGNVNAYGTDSKANAVLESENGQKGSISNCIVNAKVYGYKIVGGVVGENAGSIDSCLVFGDVENKEVGKKHGTGGIAGRNGCNNTAYETGNISNCAVFGDVESNGDYWIGGIAGFSSGQYGKADATHSTIKNCVFVGTKTDTTSASEMNNAIAGKCEGNDTDSANNYVKAGCTNTDSDAIVTGTAKELSWFSTSDAVTALSSGSRWELSGTSDAVASMLSAKGFTSFAVPAAFVSSSEATITSVAWSGESTVKTSYTVGESFDMGNLTCTATYSDGTTASLALSASVTGALTLDNNGAKVTVSAFNGTYTCPTEFTITVSEAKKVSKIEGVFYHYAPTITIYSPGENLDLTGLQAKVTYTDNSTETVTFGSTLPEGWTVNLTSPLTLEQNGTALKLTYTLDGVATEFAPCIDGSADNPVTISVIPAASQDEEGNYLIASVNDLIWFAAQVNQRGNVSYNAKQTADIDLSGVTYTPIGAASLNAFKGTYDGNGKKIIYGANTTVVTTSNNGFGFISNLGAGGTVKNLTTSGALTITDANGGAIVGKTSGANATIENCTNEATITTAKTTIGGIVGNIAKAATVKNCTNTGNITASGAPVAGIAGQLASAGSITGCTNTGNITCNGGTSDVAAGIVGNFSAGSISQCINAGDVTSVAGNAAGIVGSASANSIKTTQCANNGAITAGNNAGGIVARTTKQPYIGDCYNTGNVTSTAKSATAGAGGIIGYVDKSFNQTAGSSFENCYNAGTIAAEQATSGALVGYDVIGATLTNCYYVGTAETVAWGGTAAGNEGFTCKTFEQMCDASFPAALSKSFKLSVDEQFATAASIPPILTFEITVNPVAGATVTYSSAAEELEVGDTFTVDVTVYSDEVLTAAQLALSYNTKALSLVSIEKGKGLPEGANFDSNAKTATFNYTANTASSVSGLVVATFTFKCEATASDTNIAVVQATDANATRGDLDSKGVIVTAGTKAVSKSILAAGLEIGDVNNSGAINIVDAQVAYDLGKGAYTTEGSAVAYDKFLALDKFSTWTVESVMKVADVNNDKAIDSTDAFAIQYRSIMGKWGE